MAEIRASPVVNPSYKRIADVLAGLQGPMGQVIPFTDANPFKLLMPAAATFENLAYGNSPLAMPTGVTNRRLPIVKTGREGEFTDLASLGLLATGVPQVARGTMQGANYLGDVLTQATRAAPPAAPMRALTKVGQMSPSQGVLDETAIPIRNAMAPKGEATKITREGAPIQSAVVLIGDKIFTGQTHGQALNRAIYEGAVKKEAGKYIYPKDAEVNMDLFMTKDGRIIDRLDAYKEFDIGASETAIEKGLMQVKPASSMTVDQYMTEAEKIKSLLEPQAAIKTPKFEMPSFARLQPETSEDIDKIYDYLEERAKKSGYKIETGSSNVSGSRYLTIFEELPDDDVRSIELRVSNHGDRYPVSYADERLSIDPSVGGVDLEDALYQLQGKGYNLMKN